MGQDQYTHDTECRYYKAVMNPHPLCEHGFGACPFCDSCSCELPQHVTQIVTTLPAMEGRCGRAWRCPLDQVPRCQAEQATLACWLVQIPNTSPAWDCYMIFVIHLREIPAVPPAKKEFDEATHEFVVYALEPVDGPIDPATLLKNGYKFMRPVNIVQQAGLAAETDKANEADERAVLLCEGLVKSVLVGLLFIEPDGIMGARDAWKTIIDNTAQHLTFGYCSGSTLDQSQPEAPVN